MRRYLHLQSCAIRKVVTRGIAALALCLCLLPGAARAQTAAAGTITGTLTDQSGAVVPAATVVVQNTRTGVKSETATNGAGIYIATFLQPG